MNDKVAIIMPAYSPNIIINRALNGLKNQTKKENIVLYLINDCSPNTECEYQDLIQEYSQYFKIKYFKTERNSGPGVARQIALNKIEEKYFIFHDDDNYFYNEYVIENILNSIEKNKNKKIAAIMFSFIIEFDNERKKIIPTDYLTTWNNQTILYYKDFINKFNIKMNFKSSYYNEDIEFTYLTPIFAEIDNSLILIEKNIFIIVDHHDKTYVSLTYIDDNLDKKQKDFILLKNIFYGTIISAEIIKLYQNINFNYRPLSNQEQQAIIDLLRAFYKYSNTILSFLEQYNISYFTKKEQQYFYENVIFFLDLIDKNKAIIQKKNEMDHWYQGPNYDDISFELFKTTFEKKWNELTKI